MSRRRASPSGEGGSRRSGRRQRAKREEGRDASTPFLRRDRSCRTAGELIEGPATAMGTTARSQGPQGVHPRLGGGVRTSTGSPITTWTAPFR
jgi:hypothetical protein